LNTLADDPAEERKLMFGMIYSLRDLASKLSPTQGAEGLHTVKTNSFKLHHFQSLTGLTFAINTDPDASGNNFLHIYKSLGIIHRLDLYTSLQHVYSNIFVDCVIRNPLYRYNPDETCECQLFEKRLEDYIKGLGAFC